MNSSFFRELAKLAVVPMEETHRPFVGGLKMPRLATTSAARGAMKGVTAKGHPNAINFGSGNWATIFKGANLSSMDTQSMIATALGAAAMTATPRLATSVMRNWKNPEDSDSPSPAGIYLSGQGAQLASKAVKPALRKALSG